MNKNNFYPILLIVFVVTWAYIPLFYINLPVQDECHFFDPVYELFNSGRWAAPYDFYLGGGMEKTAYGHPPSNGLMHSVFYSLTNDGFLSVRLTAFLSRLLGSILLFLILKREKINNLIIIVSIFLFTLHNYSVFNVSRPDYFAGIALLLFTYLFRKEKYFLAAVFWAMAFSFHQIMGIVGTVFYISNIFNLLKKGFDKNIFSNKQLWVAPVAGIIGILIWITPIIIFNGIEGINQMYNGTLHHLSIVDRNIEWYTSNIWELMFDQLPYFTVLISGLIFYNKFDKYSKNLYITVVGAFIFVLLKTVNTSWYYFMFSPLYVYLFSILLSNLIKFSIEKSSKLKMALALILFTFFGLLFRFRHVTVFIKNPLDAFQNRDNYRKHLGDVVQNFPRDARVLSSPQIYHFVRPHFKESYDVEQFGAYASNEEINSFDYLLLIEEDITKGPLHRLNIEMKKAVDENFILVHEDVFENRDFGPVKFETPKFRIYKNKAKF